MKATIERIIWASEDGWTVIGLSTDEGECTATGYLTSDIKPGAEVDLTGEWVSHPKYGKQFKIATVVAVTPSTAAGVEAWLASGSIANVGPELARRIVEYFGDDSPIVINKTPERIIEVPGIGKRRVAGLIEGLKGNQATRTLIEWLGPHGVGMGMINKLIRAFSGPEEALQASHANPYRTLSKTDVPFSTVDKIALADGVGHDDIRRLNAVACYLIAGEMKKGHCYMGRGKLQVGMKEYLNFPVPDFDWADPESLTVEDWGVYLRNVRRREVSVSEWIESAVGKSSFIPSDKGMIDMVADAFDKCKVRASRMQLEAIIMAASHRACVITGGPGTGKTTIIEALVHLAESCNRTVRLLAPTGRAQLRLGQVCGRDASTIHKALILEDWDDDVIIVDEMSMVDLELMANMVGAIKRGGRLVMVGDYHQLPSVGPGNVLKDIIDSGTVPTVQLDTIFRQAGKSEIILNAHRIISGRPIESGGDMWLDYMKQRDDEEAKVYGERVEERIVQVVVDIMGKKFNPFTEIQVLLPMYKHHPSIDAINNKLQSRLNPLTVKKSYITWGTIEFRVGDKVMHIKNNYDLGVFNGEIGVVMDASEGPKRLRVVYAGSRMCSYDAETIPELKLAYAISIHKSQGSEYPCVVLGFSQSHFIMLQRNLIYTALTRAQKQCTIVGDKRSVRIAIDNDKPIYRNTRLLR